MATDLAAERYGSDADHKVATTGAVTCAKCRAAVEPEAPLFRVRAGRLIAYWCEPCALAQWSWLDRFPVLRRHRACRHCGRPMSWVGAEVWPGWYCSEACAVQARRERRRHPRVTTEAPCARCGRRFLATRSDARYCSPACRQKAYRRRWGGRILKVHDSAGGAPENGRRGDRERS